MVVLSHLKIKIDLCLKQLLSYKIKIILSNSKHLKSVNYLRLRHVEIFKHILKKMLS